MARTLSRDCRIAVVVMMAGLFCGRAFSQAVSLSEDGGAGVFQLQSALLPERPVLGISVYNHLLNIPSLDLPSFNSLIAKNRITLSDDAQTLDTSKLWALDQIVAVSFSMSPFIEARIAVPLYYQSLYYYSGDFSGHTASLATGDLRYGLKLALPVNDTSLGFALLLGGSFPSSKPGSTPVPTHLEYVPASSAVAQGPSHGAGTHRYDLDAGLAVSWDLERTNFALPVKIHFNTGVRKTSPSKGDADFQDVFSAGTGFEYHALSYLSIAGQYWHENFIRKPPFGPVIDDVSMGIILPTPIGFSVLVGGAVGLHNNMFTPVGFYDTLGRHQYDFKVRSSADAQFILALTYTGQFKPRDSDGDGIPNKFDKCPHEPQGRNGKEGCPIPDRDEDGIPDKVDKCPDEPQGVFGIEGCPIHDRDNDGVPDNEDKCPDVSEGPYGSEGCPNPDSDHDGVCDPWVGEAGLENQFITHCLGRDKCPGLPQGAYGKDGCPGVKPAPQFLPMEPKTFILEGVYFETGRAVLLPESFAALNAVVSQLLSAPATEFEVSGHTDNLGFAQFNLKLSLARAQAVANYLIQKGVAADRLKVAGYGSERPIVSNATAEGRSQNRRVEFNRIK